MRAKDNIFELCDVIRETSFALHQYLRACHVEHGLLINFGAFKLEIKKHVLSE